MPITKANKSPYRGNTRHGMCGTRFWKIFDAIKGRCKYPKNNRFKYYGGRGIKCLWNSFEGFRDDMYESYRDHVREFGEKETQIDRIDNNAHYCKENCKWSTRSEQMRNRSRFVRKLTYQNQTLDLCVWARKYGMPTGTLWSRLKRGWSLEKALKNKRYEHFQS